MSSYTEEQERVALEVLSKERHDFYNVLKVERSSDETEIKKSYRKLAIKLHPDKNPHPKASEAFKVINRAFEVLSDNEKREIFDRIGRDPDDRGVSSSASGFNGAQPGFPSDFENMFFRRQFNQGGHAAPEDIFDFLFNMNGGGSPFGGPFGGSPFGGATTFSFGPGGYRVYTNGPGGHPFAQRQRQRQQQRQQQQQQPERNDFYENIRILLPFLILFVVPLLERLLFG
ncbi:hypothetical protein Kpol_526p6 [Vanderwaltozyma polyspora DSM 70294]|uniref:J domain-containing protein n=1 Tax=Vanderwaltozyma polyspora (strain ATCC 22028 / DSM 70294 / BCRC 21397 / CBS 2163 / NBRC 10782 / NRRL Y-8283 / UCD 57-17) TaxID=436907 RepID=A7TLR2_VANPO|nr:uncharacterized protein Kpol_526p6 [Vanderwaltozyma polyspora DSM 70294]EDO16754.1 hypothetical protein Kpol_526p6 [Vanderwaltozyma polyspora DSM 70294]